jgi:hypothetical protein
MDCLGWMTFFAVLSGVMCGAVGFILGKNGWSYKR